MWSRTEPLYKLEQIRDSTCILRELGCGGRDPGWQEWCITKSHILSQQMKPDSISCHEQACNTSSSYYVLTSCLVSCIAASTLGRTVPNSVATASRAVLTK